MIEIASVRFKGETGYLTGYFIAGIPARDLSAEEWKNIPAELQTKAIRSGLYELIQVSSKKKSAKKVED